MRSHTDQSGAPRARARPAGHAAVIIVVLAVIAAACSGGDDSSSTASADDPPASAREDVASGDDELSIVVIGDSVAAGEGIAYDYRYDYDSSSPSYSHWSGGTEDPTWQGQHQLCHDDAKAYGEVVASALGADLAKFACTGATYLDGLTTAQTTGSDQTEMRPAQFGDWSTKKNLNPAYDRAAPDAVVLTFGADDVSFVEVIKYCVLGFSTADADADQRIATSDDPAAAIEGALRQQAPQLKAARQQGDDSPVPDSSSSVCTATNPGQTIEKLFWEPIRSGEIAQHYQDMVTAIGDRGKDSAYGDGDVPEIVFTTYHHPLPEGLDGDCWDVYPLSSAEQRYLQSLQETLQTTLEDAVKDLDGVSIADISDSMDGHEWCTEDPWVYGLSIINRELHIDSQAPFHPTPAGQEAIAKTVEETLRSVTGD